MGELLRRNILVVNLDPAAETFKYKCDIGTLYLNTNLPISSYFRYSRADSNRRCHGRIKIRAQWRIDL